MPHPVCGAVPASPHLHGWEVGPWVLPSLQDVSVKRWGWGGTHTVFGGCAGRAVPAVPPAAARAWGRRGRANRPPHPRPSCRRSGEERRPPRRAAGAWRFPRSGRPWAAGRHGAGLTASVSVCRLSAVRVKAATAGDAEARRSLMWGAGETWCRTGCLRTKRRRLRASGLFEKHVVVTLKTLLKLL